MTQGEDPNDTLKKPWKSYSGFWKSVNPLKISIILHKYDLKIAGQQLFIEKMNQYYYGHSPTACTSLAASTPHHAIVVVLNGQWSFSLASREQNFITIAREYVPEKQKMLILAVPLPKRKTKTMPLFTLPMPKKTANIPLYGSESHG